MRAISDLMTALIWSVPSVEETEMDDVGYAHARIAAEWDVVKATMSYYRHTLEHPTCGMPPMLVGPCRALAALIQEWESGSETAVPQQGAMSE